MFRRDFLFCTMFLPTRTPALVRSVFPGMVWRFATTPDKVIYLTFDDGPIPTLTPWVLDELEKVNAKATFFCVGENAHKHPEILTETINRGHVIGNHTYNHLHGWKTAKTTYCRNVLKAGFQLKTKLFRPPYGKLSFGQYETLKKHYKIIMWSVLTKDYDQKTNPKQCLQRSLKAKSGDIVLFHDNIKARKNLEYALPRFLKHYTELGFEFRRID